MPVKITLLLVCLTSAFITVNISAQTNKSGTELRINSKGYYELPGLDVMVFDDFYPEGHQGGLTIVHFGKRVASNGDVRLEQTPGQWSPVPKAGDKNIDRKNGIISVNLWYPDSSRNRKGFNPIDYPDLQFKYTIRTIAEGQSIRVIVDLDRPLPQNWDKKVGFNLELFPGEFYGEYYLMDNNGGVFPRQVTSPMTEDNDKNLVITPMAAGSKLVIAPGGGEKEIKFESFRNNLELIDGSGLFNNGWFILRSAISAGETKNAVEWLITPKVNTEWRYAPVIQVSQVGYHPKQIKFAVIELDKLTDKFEPIQLIKINDNSQSVVKSDNNPAPWGNYLRYKYLRFDFSNITEEGLYKIKYGNVESNEFLVKNDIFTNNVWQPTLEYFLPAQMCHMRVEDRYHVWHGLCHMDDALMAPINHNHFDGYAQGESTWTSYKPGEHVPGLNIGGWHDAGDYDLRVESQAETVYKLALAYELFKNNYDCTTVNQTTRLVELNKPDGKPDILQQIEHGLLSIVGGYESMGRLYYGIQEATLHQYVLLGEAANATDNLIYKKGDKDPVLNSPLPEDDRLVFTEKKPERELNTAYALAAAYRVMQKFNPALADKCIKIAEEIYNNDSSAKDKYKINAAGELYLSTSKQEYKNFLIKNVDLICKDPVSYSMVLGRVSAKINDPLFTGKIEKAVAGVFKLVSEQQKENPYGVPYKPYIWGAGWGIQAFGVDQLFLYLGFPKVFGNDYVFNALNFVLGCHPGANTASFVSGVGVNSITTAYGTNRADWSFIPGGVCSGTALIRPDLPELKKWPYFWQQTEYVLGGGTADYIMLAMAVDYLFNGK